MHYMNLIKLDISREIELIADNTFVMVLVLVLVSV